MKAFILSIALVATLPACSSGYEAPPMPNGDTPLAKLSDGERAQLCDNMAALRGGYGASTREGCGADAESATVSAPVSQSACVTALEAVESGCAATVTDALTCTDDTRDPCATATPASCAPLQSAACHWSVTPSTT